VSQLHHKKHLLGTSLLVFDLPCLILDLLLQLINKPLGSQQDRLLVAAQRLIAQLEQQVQEQVWQIQDKEHCIELSSMYLISLTACNCACLSHRLFTGGCFVSFSCNTFILYVDTFFTHSIMP